MINNYDDESDTVSQVMIDWFSERIKKIPDFSQDQIYQSTLLIDEKTPLPCISFYRNRLEPYNGKDKCAGKIKFSFDFGVCYFTYPTSTQYFNNVLYHFEEKVILDILKLIETDDLPNHQKYPYLDKSVTIEDVNFKHSNITTILTNGTNYNWGNMVRLIYQVDFSVDINKLQENDGNEI